MKMLPIGIFSGTFDPIHLGHIHLANKILKLLNFQKILLIPCMQSPLRDQPIASAQDRFNMVKLAIGNQNYLVADDREIKRGGISYTIKTIESLRQENPDSPLILIMAMDVFDKFNEWHEKDKILKHAHLLVTSRVGFTKSANFQTIKILNKYQTQDLKQLENNLGGFIYLTNIDTLPINATEIRSLIKNQEDASQLVPSKVWQYICQHHLYQRGIKN